MKDLLELVQLVSPAKLNTVHIGLFGAKTSKLQTFYDLVVEGKFKEDEDAALHFYTKDKLDPAYQKLRKTLKDRLTSFLFLIDLDAPTYTDRQKAYYECYREWAAAKILYGKNARTAANSLSRKILRIARKYEFTELRLDICHSLRLYYGTIEGDVKMFQQYNEEFKEMTQLWLEESLAEELYILLIISFINSKSTKKDYQEMAKGYHQQLKPALEKFDSHQLHFYGRLIEVAIYTSVNDYVQTLKVCEETIAFFEHKDFTANTALNIFHYEKLICYLQLRRFKEATSTAELCLAHLEEGTFNWFKLYELYFLVHMHSGCYACAVDKLKRIMEHPVFVKLPENIQETWKIFDAYTYFLEMIGLLAHGDQEGHQHKGFRMTKFLNEMQVFSKDKQGMNIPILVLEILMAVAKKQYSELIDRLEAIDKYRRRYLNGADTERTNLFLKMLLQLPKSGFQKEVIIHKTQHYISELEAIPIEMANQAHEIEILPYEVLWQIVLDQL